MYSQLHYIFFGCLLSLCGLGRVNGFGVQHHVARKFQSRVMLHSTAASESTDMDAGIVVDDKQLVKLFGRLAEKYIMLDASGGMCCYSACKGMIIILCFKNVSNKVLFVFSSHLAIVDIDVIVDVDVVDKI